MFMSGNKQMRGAILATTILASAALSGCGGGSAVSGGIYAGHSEDPMVFTTVYSSSGQLPSTDQYRLVTAIATDICHVQVDGQLESAWNSRLSGAVAYAVPYAVSGAANGLYPGATLETAGVGAVVGGIAGAGAGDAYGNIVHGQNRAMQFGECIKGAFDSWRRGDPIAPSISAAMGGDANVLRLMRNLSVGTSWTATKNRSSGPSWSGPVAGTVIGR